MRSFINIFNVIYKEFSGAYGESNDAVSNVFNIKVISKFCCIVALFMSASVIINNEPDVIPD